MRLQFGIRSLLLVLFVLAVALTVKIYIRELRRENWRELSQSNFEKSLASNQLVLLEFSEITMRHRWDQHNDFVNSADCWQCLNWNKVHAYQIDAGLFTEDKKWLLNWVRQYIDGRDAFTAVVVYDSLKDELIEFEERDPKSVIQTIGRLKNAR